MTKCVTIVYSTFVLCAQTLLCPQTSFYSKLSEEFVDAGVGIDLFISTTSYNDLATIAQCVSTTGGRLHHYPAFKVGGADRPNLVEGGLLVCSSAHQHLLWLILCALFGSNFSHHAYCERTC